MNQAAVSLAPPTVAQKRHRIRELGTLISLHTELLPMQVRMEIENEQFRVEYRLKQLQKQRRQQIKKNYADEECNLKIAALEKVLAILNDYRKRNGTQN